ncbi:MAG: protein kinase [Deltaproteobacteria bacterium]|nr:protein kinase [Deltaproteobacteria bacterium]
MLELAAQSIARISGVDETVVDVLHGRAFKHYEPSLRQYLATRVGDVAAADAALAELRAVAAAKGAKELTRTPGIRANLYRLAREIAGHPREGLDGTASVRRKHLPWLTPRGTASTNPAILSRLREAITGSAQELLELRYARELSPPEIAYVLEREEAEVDRDLSAALLKARGIVSDAAVTAGGRIGQTLLEAFSLDLPKGSLRIDPDDRRKPLDVGTVIGVRYALQERVGSGSFADVYRAADRDVPGHVVALKLLHQASLSETAKQSALRELHIIASVFHPSVVQFKDHGWHESRLWFVMPWYEGETLDARIARGPLTRREARDIFGPLARALATMHDAGIRHQDVKPDNIFLADLPGFAFAGGVLPVLLDLGVAAKDAEMVVAGTPTYFAPEVAAQFADVPVTEGIGSKADVFSLALALRNALEPDSQDDVSAGAIESFIAHRATEQPEPPFDPKLKFLKPHFARWMAMKPDDRPTAEELADELEVLTSPEDRRARTLRLVRWLGPLLLTLGITFGAVVYILGQQTRVQELEAVQARIEAAETRDSLILEEVRRRALESDVADARREYEASDQTREELAGRLAETEGDLTVVRDGLRGERSRVASLRDRLGSARQRNEGLSSDLTETRDNLGRTERSLTASQRRVSELNTRVEGFRTELIALRAEGERERRRIADLTAEASTLRGQLAGVRAQSGELERRLAAAERDKAQAEAQLSAANRRIAELERNLAAARTGPRVRAPEAEAPTTTGTPMVRPPPANPGINVAPGTTVVEP